LLSIFYLNHCFDQYTLFCICQIIVAAAGSPALVDVVFGAVRVLVWSEAGIDTAAYLLDTGQAPAEAGVVDTPAGRAGAAADILAGTAVVVDSPAAQP
jgi:hypothetical protein